MFKFSNIKKLFNYKWGSLVKNILPKGNIMATIEEEEYKNINNGAIVRIIAIAFSKLATIGLAIWIVVKAYSAVYGDEIVSYAMSTVLSENAGEYIVDIITAAILPIGLLIYNIVMKNKKQSYWVYFIVLIYALLQTVYSMLGIFGWLGSLLVSPIFALIGIISIFLTFLGNVHIAVGCVDFCVKNKPQATANQNTQESGNYQLNATANITQQTVGSYQPNPVNNIQTQVELNNTISNQNTEQTIGNYQPSVASVNNVVPNQPTIPNVEVPTMENTNAVNETQTIPQQRFCTHCGNQIVPGTTACPSCNNSIN